MATSNSQSGSSISGALWGIYPLQVCRSPHEGIKYNEGPLSLPRVTSEHMCTKTLVKKECQTLLETSEHPTQASVVTCDKQLQTVKTFNPPRRAAEGYHRPFSRNPAKRLCSS